MVKVPGDEYKSQWREFSKRRTLFSTTEKYAIGSQLDECSRTLDRHRDSLLDYPNVVGTGVSMKFKNGEVLDRPCIVIYVTKKIPNLKKGAIPAEIDGCPTDVVETGVPTLRSTSFPGPVCPLQPGYSIGHYKVTSGTLGCLVREKSGVGVSKSPFSDILLLSNNHVLANNNRAKKGHSIQHPGPLNQLPLKPSLKSAFLKRWKPLVRLPAVNEIDAAVAKPIIPVSPDIKLIGIPNGLRSVNQSIIGIQVQMTGARIGHQTATVTGPINQTIDIPGVIGLGTIRFLNCIATTAMSSPLGDSGSLLLDNDRKALGLFFCWNQHS